MMEGVRPDTMGVMIWCALACLALFWAPFLWWLL
jgi:hypothetical protein